MDNKYVKVVYQSDPIGKEGIILYLTTFDVEKYDEEQKEKLKKREQIYIRTFEKEDLLNPYFLEQLEKDINNAVIQLYGEQLKKLENIYNSQQITYSFEPKLIDINNEKVE